MKPLLLSALLLFFLQGHSQRVIVMANNVYTSYFSPNLHEPLYVVYQLFKGGGDCDRSSFTFNGTGCDQCATDGDYAHSGFEKGHLCNAEDEAFDCTRDEFTFRYFNCVPQTVRLNRGVWKSWETFIRKESQSEKLQIICGSIFGRKKIGKAAVPTFCWKIVYSVSPRKLRYCLIFSNDGSGNVQSISLQDLKGRLGYVLKYNQ